MELGHAYLRQAAPSGRPRPAGAFAAFLLATAIVVALLGPAQHRVARLAPGTPAFVAQALGAPRSTLPAVSSPRNRSSSTVTSSGFQVRLGRASVSLSSTTGARSRWTPYDDGAARPTRYGQELVTVSGSGAEQLLQVDRHQGKRTWSWKLETSGLIPTLRKDGAVAFAGAGGKDTGLRIAPVELLDTQGRPVTPKGLRWSLARRGGVDFLELRLDDSSLPVPYLIDPSVSSVAFSGSSQAAGATADWTVGFTPSASGALSNGSTITVQFSTSPGFTVPATPTIALGAGFSSCTATGAGVPATATVTITLHGASCSLGSSTAASLTIDGLTNPTQAAGILASNFTVKTSADTTPWSPGAPVSIVAGPYVGLQLIMPGMAQQGGSPCGYTACPPTVSPQTAGTGFSATVNAVDQYGNTATGITDTVDMTSNDPQAVLPADFALVGGTKTFIMTLKSSYDPSYNPINVTASDVTDGSKTPSVSPDVEVDPLAASQLQVFSLSPANVTAGTDMDILVIPVDAYGNGAAVTADTTVALSASGAGTLTGGSGVISPSDPVTFGYYVELPTVEYTKAETITLTASVTAGPALATSAPSDPITIDPAAATKLVVGAPASTVAGAPLAVGVTAEDQFDNVDTNYTGTVSLTSSDGLAVLPGAHTFTGGDAGTHSFPVTLKTLGSQTVSAGDGSFSASSGPIAVAVGSASTFALTGTPASLSAGGTGSVTVTAHDAYGNTVTGFTGTVHFTSTDGAAGLPADYTFTGGDAGVHTFTGAYTLKTAGSQTITATSGSVTGTSGGITVTPGPAATLTAAAAGAVALNTALPVTVTAKDSYGNVATGYTGTVALTSSDGAATLSGAHAYVVGDAGVHVFSATFATSGTQTVTATDAGNSLSGTTGPIGVGAGAASGATSTIGAAPGSITADGTSTSAITVHLKDTFGTSLAAGGDTVLLSTTGGTLSAVTDNHDGTYSATLTAPSSPGSGVVSGTVNGAPITSTATVTFTAAGPPPAGPASGATSTIGASPTSIAADGVSTSTITVQLEDAVGTSLTSGGDLVVLSTTNGSLTPVTDNLNGTYSATLTSPSSAGSGTVSGTVNGTPIVSTATVTFTAGPPPPAGPAPLVCGPGLTLSSNGKWCVGPPPPPIVFLGSSPADGAVVSALDSITLTANHMATWYAISVTGPDGGTTTIAPGFGVSYSQPFVPPAPGVYTLRATMDDGWNPVQQITAHFTVVPADPDIAVPGKAGSIEAESGDTTVSWTATTFTQPVRVRLDDAPSLGGSIGRAGPVVRVTVTKLADGSVVQTFPQPLELVFAAGPVGVPSFSEDGVSWAPLPELTSDVLPAGQDDGYYTDATGAIHVLTRHLTFFGVLVPGATRLALTVAGSAVRVLGRARQISVAVEVTRGARIVATLYSPHGELVQTWTRTVPAGASTLRLSLPAAKVRPGLCTIVLQATTPEQTAQGAVHLSLR